MPFAYVLRSLSTTQLYTGATANLAIRLAQHNSNQSRSTKNRGPWALVHHEEFATMTEALRRKRELKTGKGRDEIRSILADQDQSRSGEPSLLSSSK
jgi:putative endonuclease